MAGGACQTSARHTRAPGGRREPTKGARRGTSSHPGGHRSDTQRIRDGPTRDAPRRSPRTVAAAGPGPCTRESRTRARSVRAGDSAGAQGSTFSCGAPRHHINGPRWTAPRRWAAWTGAHRVPAVAAAADERGRGSGARGANARASTKYPKLGLPRGARDSGGARDRPGEGAAVSHRGRMLNGRGSRASGRGGGIPRVGDLWLKGCCSCLSIASGQRRIREES